MKVLCLLIGHNFQIAHDHPDGKMGYSIYECSRCPAARVHEPGMGVFPILNTQEALRRDAAKVTTHKQKSGA